MEVCKQWDDTLRNSPICVSPDSVQEPETAPCDVHQADNTNEECRENEEAQQVISNVVDSVRLMESEGKHAISYTQMRFYIKHGISYTHAISKIHMRFHAYI
ncbi:hypothetical protein Hanom_Chr10g00883361 [Helianthus anomalus]